MAREPVVVLVGGEAGIGKTRLVEEAAAQARAEGARVVVKGRIELGGEGLPPGPVVDVLRSLTMAAVSGCRNGKRSRALAATV